MAKMGFERAAEQEQVKLGELLWDIHAAGMKIAEFTSGRDFEEFEGSELLQSVVGSMLGIIADALRQLHAQFPDEFAKLSNSIRLSEPPPSAPEKLWRIVEGDTPGLIADSRGILEDWHQA